ncbi:MAG: hypothetical protein WEB06_03055 [Actinomycetota bacterium]
MLILTACGEKPAFGGMQQPTTQRVPARPGQTMSHGISFEKIQSAKVIHLLSVEPVSKSPSLQVVEVVAFRPSELGAMILSDQYPPIVFPGHVFDPHPIGDVSLQPQEIPDWQILVALRSDSIGLHRVRHLRVTYEVGGETQSQIWPYVLELEVVDCSITARQQEFVCRGEPIKPRSS